MELERRQLREEREKVVRDATSASAPSLVALASSSTADAPAPSMDTAGNAKRDTAAVAATLKVDHVGGMGVVGVPRL